MPHLQNNNYETRPVVETGLHTFAVPSEFADFDFYDMSLRAREYLDGITRVTPVVESPGLSSDHAKVVVKDERQQIGKAFKPRGAEYAVAEYVGQGVEGFGTRSAGTFSSAMGRAAARHGVAAWGSVPFNTPKVKHALMQASGVVVEEYGEDFDAGLEHAMERCEAMGFKFLHPFADPYGVAGQASLGHELVEQVPDMTDLVLEWGGGSLASGVATVIRRLRPDVRITVAQVVGCSAFADSVRTGKEIEMSQAELDKRFGGVAVRKTHPLTLAMGSRLVDQVVVVSADAAIGATEAFQATNEDGKPVELASGPAFAVAKYIAALPESLGRTVVTVASGGNVDPSNS